MKLAIVTTAAMAALAMGDGEAQQGRTADDRPAHNVYVLKGCLTADREGSDRYILKDATPVGPAPPSAGGGRVGHGVLAARRVGGDRQRCHGRRAAGAGRICRRSGRAAPGCGATGRDHAGCSDRRSERRASECRCGASSGRLDGFVDHAAGRSLRRLAREGGLPRRSRWYKYGQPLLEYCGPSYGLGRCNRLWLSLATGVRQPEFARSRLLTPRATRVANGSKAK